jgi:SAP domain-containing ribonucleoprotein
MSSSDTMSEARLRLLKVSELKELLAKRGLTLSGKKDELIARLLNAEQSSNKNGATDVSHDLISSKSEEKHHDFNDDDLRDLLKSPGLEVSLEDNYDVNFDDWDDEVK